MRTRAAMLVACALLPACEALWGDFRAPHRGDADGAADLKAPPDQGQPPDLASCGPPRCAGCCAAGACVTAPTFPRCGSGGGACNDCATAGDRCDANGGCSCGSFAACAPGQRCQGGTCVCDATSCPSGCCRNNQCLEMIFPLCGSGGVTCVSCDSTLTDRCSNNQCICGASGRACRKESSEICENGRCKPI